MGSSYVCVVVKFRKKKEEVVMKKCGSGTGQEETGWIQVPWLVGVWIPTKSGW